MANFCRQYNKNQNCNTTLERKETRILNQFKEKLNNNNALISKLDKGNSVIIIYRNICNENIMNFTHNNKFANTKGDLTKRKFQKTLRKNINECLHIIRKDEVWKYINLNPSQPIIRGLIKIHKIGYPIRHIVNWKDAPA